MKSRRISKLQRIPKDSSNEELHEAIEEIERLEDDAFDRWMNGMGPLDE